MLRTQLIEMTAFRKLLVIALSPRSLVLRVVGYTTFSYSDLKAEFANGNLTVSVTVKNTGLTDGAEIIQ